MFVGGEGGRTGNPPFHVLLRGLSVLLLPKESHTTRSSKKFPPPTRACSFFKGVKPYLLSWRAGLEGRRYIGSRWAAFTGEHTDQDPNMLII